MPMTQWEYGELIVVFVDQQDDRQKPGVFFDSATSGGVMTEFESKFDALEILGKNGWEMISVLPIYTKVRDFHNSYGRNPSLEATAWRYIFKRPIEESGYTRT